MNDQASARGAPEEPLDLARLQPWLDATLPGGKAPATATKVTGGASNLIYRIERAGQTFALRMPPARRNDTTSDTIRRELSLLKALAASDIRHPRLVAGCEDAAVMGVPFALLQWVDGFTPGRDLPPGFAEPVAKRAMAEELIDSLATVSNADWKGLGLQGFGKPDGFLERQVDRWLAQLERARTRELEHLDAICAWLRAHTPKMQRPGLIHGDYQFINVMFGREAPPRLAAIVDWESATIGDPLLDLGWVLAGWRDPGEAPSHASYFDWTDMPTRAEMAQRYAAATGLDPENLAFYLTLALFKLGVIMEGWYARFLAGQSTHPAHGAMKDGVPQMLARAAAFAGLA